MRRRLFLVLVAVLAAGLAPVAGVAHAFLDHAEPPVGGTVAASPPAIRIFFTEAVEPAFSSAALAGADGRPVATGAATVDPANPMELVLVVPPLAPGRYTVTWAVVSVDTHRTEGHFSFAVGG